MQSRMDNPFEVFTSSKNRDSDSDAIERAIAEVEAAFKPILRDIPPRIIGFGLFPQFKPSRSE